MSNSKPYVVARCTQAGVVAGYYEGTEGGRVILTEARQIWEFHGAQTLHEIAVYGFSDVARTKISPRTPRDEILEADVCNLIFCQPEGQAKIEAQPDWRK